MGDRISIQFEKDGRRSVALFSHWDGKAFLNEALSYLRHLKEERGDSHTYPLDRLEPETVMVDFIRHLTKGHDRITGNYYLGADETQGDNSDNGNFVIDVVYEKFR